MRDSGYLMKYIIIAVIQVVLWNYLTFSPFIIIVFLPAMIMFLPTSYSTIYALVLAFVTGFLVDFTASGMIGLSSIALLPVAFLRQSIVTLIFGEEMLVLGENVSIQRQSANKIVLTIILVNAIFLALYIWADGAGVRPIWFNLTKFGISLVLSSIISFFVVLIMDPENV